MVEEVKESPVVMIVTSGFFHTYSIFSSLAQYRG